MTAKELYDRACYDSDCWGKGGDKAIAILTQAIQIDPKYGEAYSLRAQLYFEKGDFDRAIADHNESIRINPDHQGYYCQRGRAYKAKGDKERARADFAMAEKICPGVTEGDDNYSL
jgi:tetratricopeptide (TPR) repeat protein